MLPPPLRTSTEGYRESEYNDVIWHDDAHYRPLDYCNKILQMAHGYEEEEGATHRTSAALHTATFAFALVANNILK